MADKLSTRNTVIKYESEMSHKSKRRAVLGIAVTLAIAPLPIIFPLLTKGGVSPIISFVILLAAFTFLIGFYVSFQRYLRNRETKLILTDSGLMLPDKSNSNNQTIFWSQVENIKVDDNIIHFVFKDKKPFQLNLDLLSYENKDKLVSGISLWANKWTKDQTFLQLADKITGARHEMKDSETSFTSLWLEEAHRRLSTTPFTPLSPGTQLQDGRVTVVQPLTAGGWSAIYLCQWQGKTPAILKEAVVPPSSKENVREKAYELFQREALILAGLNHPQITKVIDYFVENNRQYMVLARVNGVNLRNYINDKGAVSEKQTLVWVKQLAEVVDYLHAQDPPVIHRDLTPENLVLDIRGSLVLIDFGSANEFLGTVTGTLVGKPSYISPEQFSGRANTQSDLYSVGAVMSFLLTGKDPTPLAVARISETLPSVNPQLNDLIAELMNLDSKLRVQSAQDLISRLSCLESPAPDHHLDRV
jgi:tRNA A-37 threonylcarbamoyl transferase component Bud32